MTETMKRGTELKVDDLVSVWWRKNGVRILGLRPHPKFEEMFGESGAMIANFDGTEMTIDPQHMYTVFTA